MELEYNLDYGKGVLSVIAENFDEALKKLNDHLKSDCKENQIRIKSVIRLN